MTGDICPAFHTPLLSRPSSITVEQTECTGVFLKALAETYCKFGAEIFNVLVTAFPFFVQDAMLCMKVGIVLQLLEMSSQMSRIKEKNQYLASQKKKKGKRNVNPCLP